MDYANTNNVEFIVDPMVLFHVWLIYCYLQIFNLIKCYKWLPGECTDWFFDNIVTRSYCVHRRYSMSQQKKKNKWACAEPWTCPFNVEWLFGLKQPIRCTKLYAKSASMPNPTKRLWDHANVPRCQASLWSVFSIILVWKLLACENKTLLQWKSKWVYLHKDDPS